MALSINRISGDAVRITSDTYKRVRIDVTRSREARSSGKWRVIYRKEGNREAKIVPEVKVLKEFDSAEEAVLFAKEYLEKGEAELTEALQRAELT